ncbi:MAG: hypothetical protein WC119_00640 [Synergistaceae bacterium]
MTTKKRTRRSKIKTYAPIFPGFYGTIFSSDDSDEEREEIVSLISEIIKPDYAKHTNALADIIVNSNIYSINWREYEKEYCIRICDYLSSELSDIPGFQALELENVINPKEYNFANDSINCLVIVNSIPKFREWILNICKEHEELFTDWIHDRYTGYDGFIPSYSNDASEWLKIIKKKSLDGHYCGTILEFYLTMVKKIGVEDLYYGVESPSISGYMKIDIDKRGLKATYPILETIEKGEKQDTSFLKEVS